MLNNALILNQIMYFNLIDENNKDLLEGFHNNLMMFRTDASFPNGKVIRYGYTIGYKVINDDIFARVKFTTGAEGVQFKIEITAKREFKDKIKLVYNSSKDNNTPQVLSQYIKLIKDICFKFINNFENPEEKNLLFTGNTGLGKTFISSCIANELIKKNKTVLYQTAPVMLDTIIDYRFGKNTNSNILENILNVDLLIIDDLGTECVNNMKFTELFNIINTRLLNQKNITKTIISTNLSLQNLYNTYDERIVSRIVGNYNICYFFGDDIRFKKICE